jgi:lipopolysaccharide/colanic/teichoic acid biosynthesis glycosyltransferase
VTIVVGSPEFCRQAVDAAAHRRSACVLWPVVEPAELAAGPPPVGLAQELVVQGALLNRLPAAAVEMLRPEREVRVVPEGAPIDVAFDAPLDYPELCVKRAIDVALAIVLLVVTFSALVAASVAILLDSGRPVFFVQTRLGRGGRPFRLWKLRTMVPGGEAEQRSYLQAMTRGAAGPQAGVFKPMEHARVTRVGRVLRRFSIDEVPQLWNILMGDMSLVGPRPPLLHEAAVYDSHSWQRLRVKPGLTGLSQVSGRSALPFSDIVALDVAYASYWSPMMELRILAKTPLAVLSARNAR